MVDYRLELEKEKLAALNKQLAHKKALCTRSQQWRQTLEAEVQREVTDEVLRVLVEAANFDCLIIDSDMLIEKESIPMEKLKELKRIVDDLSGNLRRRDEFDDE